MTVRRMGRRRPCPSTERMGRRRDKNLFAALACAFVALASCMPAPTRPLPPPPVQTVPTLTVVTVNVANAFALGNITWETKMDRLAEQIAASRQVPDIISMTESSGWTSCSSRPRTTAATTNSGSPHLAAAQRHRCDLPRGVTWSGADGTFGWGRCRYYTGDTVLYNPNRITNLTPSDVAGRAQVPHNHNISGFLVRRSLPICNRGARTNIPNLEQLIDGPPQVDKCNRPTPSAPVWDGRFRIRGAAMQSSPRWRVSGWSVFPIRRSMS